MVRKIFLLASLIIVIAIIGLSFFWENSWWLFVLFGPIILIGIRDLFQKKHTIKRNFPIIGNFRYMLELVRPEIMQYFVETDIEGTPINRMFRSLIYQRAKKVNDTYPFGTRVDVYRTGYEWMEHSMSPVSYDDLNHDPRVLVGGPDCKKPYSASVLNISAMSFGSLSSRAILSLNGGAKLDNFAHNTGEGGISSYHLKNGGDLIWQIGTGYFGCRDLEGNFSPEMFEEKANLENVKMIEIKLSQGAKPGHGGILPAGKNTEEIAKIRGVKAHTKVMSPPGHKAFSNFTELVLFIKQLRDLSGGKPVGFKLSVGKKQEFIAICQAMIKTGIKPDFITVDGGEGGTGAAPVEFTNSLGDPMREAIAFIDDALTGFDLRKDIKIIASGKILTGFHMIRAFSLGADLCNSARAMMMATGCIQALQCNLNTCPVGVATQDKSLIKGLDVEDKTNRVASYHRETIISMVEMLGAAGLKSSEEVDRRLINRRVSMMDIKRYDEIYPPLEQACFLKAENISSFWKTRIKDAEALN